MIVATPHRIAASVTWALPCTAAQWLEALPTHAAAALSVYLADNPTALQASTLTVPAAVVATWSASVATALSLPPNAPLGFDLRLSGALGKPGACITVRWLQPGKTVAARDVQTDGLWLTWQEQPYRIASPMFEVLGLMEQFNQAGSSGYEEQFRIWAHIRQTLGDTASDQLTDGFLRNLRVVTATALTFAINTDSHGDVQLDPVLLSSRRADEGEGTQQVRALLEGDEALFPKRLDQLPSGASAFALNQGTYVVVDEPLQQALAAVQQLRRAPAHVRKRAAMYPEAVLREYMGAEESAPTVFVETERFAERVRDVGEWQAPLLPWVKIDPQSWVAPVVAGVRLGGVELPLDIATLERSLGDMQTALAQGQSTIAIADQAVAATPANVAALQQLHQVMTREEGAQKLQAGDAESVKNVLIIETNLDETSFARTTTAQRPGQQVLPFGLKTRPKKHQEFGITWLQQHWCQGSHGAMLCDDMGLGKTFQALAFCLWLREQMQAGHIPTKPLLLIAPVGLLRNWEAEIDVHLMAPGLGNLVRAYGEHLKHLKRGRHSDGTAGLDTARLGSSDVVLANYEAVSDYQLSFGAIQFAVVVLDEAQKIKSPKARMTHAVKALNADFVLAMTGTPVENRLADLWCIADAVQPGALADLKDFSARYETEGAEVQALRQLVWQSEDHAPGLPPRLLLRRMKTEKLDGLPEKQEHVLQVPMPARQAEAYQRALALKDAASSYATLEMIHALRQASLHPALLEGGLGNEELRFEDSARFMAMVQVLDAIAPKNEKVLIFLESLDLQEANQLPLLLQRRYKILHMPMVINGQVQTEARQQRVNKFQQESGFDVMLLSPKAGGVGLTLTAANHVIHLSRWWNPAVEDQCSDRVYRIGQTKPVHIYYPLAVIPGAEEHSFDVQLQALMDRKRKLAHDLLAAPAFSSRDYESLLASIS